ncbi:hypothetical protein [Methanothermococcus okinawensis]|uniref:Condensin complex subunit 1 C-terminal domain-containing protein n=1 Tax=Methanothermococcus okinawensis (strain DSM 14208 / JCM 11175 / IH1) TaxID=647113 RepID=F8ALW1_METOI|nr:hypothetical protein [Methanothermococcus okinawensis]AEH07524.1 hypothetical protein Metok_1561 [Methanothermococcus okinawensis IH1]
MDRDASKEELSKLFKEYCELDWKKKSEAARILSYINNANEIKKLEEQIIKLAQDNNLVTRINLMNSIKKLVLDHHIINEDIFVLLYFWANSPNTTTSEFAKQIINSLNVNTIVRYIHSLSLKLYSSNPYEVTYAMVSLGLISTITPEHLTNTLPEIVLVSNGYGYKILQVLAIEILEEFKTLDKNYLINLYYMVYLKHRNNTFNNFNFKKSDRYKFLKWLYNLYFKEMVSKEELLEVIKNALNDEEEYLIKSMIMATLHIHSDVLCQILEENKELSNQLMDKIIASFDNPSWMVKLSSMFLFKRLILFDKLHIKDEYLDMFFNRILKNFNDKYVIKGFSLEILYYLFKNTESEYIKRKVFEIVDKIDLKSIMNEGHLCYYNGLYLAYELKRYECFSATCSPNFDIGIIKELEDMDISEFQKLIKSLYINMKRKNWLDRYYAGKYLGNLIYIRPSYGSRKFDLINDMLYDNVYLVRNMGLWLLRMNVELNNKIPNNVFVKSTYLFDDWYFGNRIEYLLFYNILIENFPNILKKEEVEKNIISAIMTKYLTDRHRFVRNISKKLLDNLLIKYPEYIEFLDYNSKSITEQVDLIKKYLKFPETRKSIILLAKIGINRHIKKGDYNSIEMILKAFENNIYKEIIFILPEIIGLKDKSETAKKIIKDYLSKYPILPQDMEDIIYRIIREPVFKIRNTQLKILYSFVNEGFIISNRLLNRVKELVIYEYVAEENINLSLSILEKMNEPESRSIIKEKRELMEYLKEHPFNLEVENININKNIEWEYYSKIIYIPTKNSFECMGCNSINDIVKTIIQILNYEDMVILKIMALDLLIEEISKNDNPLNELLLTNLYNILSKLASLEGYELLSEKALILLEEIALKKDNWLKNNLINNPGDESTLIVIKKFLQRDVSIYVKSEIIEALEYLLKNKFIECDKDVAYAFLDTIMNIDKDQPWIIFKKAVDILRLCQYIHEDKKLLSKIVKKIMDYIEESEYPAVKEYLINLLESLNIKDKVDKEVIDEYIEKYTELKK